MIPFDTPVVKLREVREVLLQAIRTVPEVRVDHVHLMGYAKSGYNYEAAFYVLKQNIGRSFDIQQEVYFMIAESLEKIGIVPTAQGQDIMLKSQPKLKKIN